MKNVDINYEKYIRYYLDSILSTKNNTHQKYADNPNKKFIEHIKRKSGNENYLFSSPMSIFWNLTSACNFRCIHCLYNDTEYSLKHDLSVDQASLLADELIDSGVTYVVLSGGEIFMRPDLMDIIKKLKSNNIAVRLLTNAALINDQIIDELAQIFNPYTDAISVSLDGAGPETFKKIRQTDTFEKITTNIKKMTEKNIRVTVVCTVNNINYSEVVDTYILAHNLGAYNFIVGNLVCYNESHQKLAVSNRNLFELFYNLSKTKFKDTLLETNFWSPIELLNIPEVFNIINNDYQSLLKENYPKVLSRNCQCHDRLAIDADGTVYLCIEAIAHKLAPLGNYKKSSINKIWEKRRNNILFKQRKIENMSCNKCKYNVFCNSGCPVKTYITSNRDKLLIPSCNIYSK